MTRKLSSNWAWQGWRHQRLIERRFNLPENEAPAAASPIAFLNRKRCFSSGVLPRRGR